MAAKELGEFAAAIKERLMRLPFADAPGLPRRVPLPWVQGGSVWRWLVRAQYEAAANIVHTQAFLRDGCICFYRAEPGWRPLLGQRRSDR